MSSRNIVVTAALEKLANFRERKYASIKQEFENALKKRAAAEATVMKYLSLKSEQTVRDVGEIKKQGYLESLVYDFRPFYPVNFGDIDNLIERILNTIVSVAREEVKKNG